MNATEVSKKQGWNPVPAKTIDQFHWSYRDEFSDPNRQLVNPEVPYVNSEASLAKTTRCT